MSAHLFARANPAYQPLTGRERWNLYLHDAYWSLGAFFRAAVPAAGGQINDDPPEWRQGMESYRKRFANRFGCFALQQSYEAAGARSDSFAAPAPAFCHELLTSRA